MKLWTKMMGGTGRYVAPLMAAALVAACVEIGGKSLSESKPGNAPDGNVLGTSLIVSEDGRYLVAQIDDPVARVWSADLSTFGSVPLAVDAGAHRMVFGRQDRGYFVSSTSAGDSRVVEISLATGKKLRSWTLDLEASYLTIDPAGQRLAVWSWTGGAVVEGEEPKVVRRVGAIDLAAEGKAAVKVRTFEAHVRDVRWTHAPGELAVVEDLGQATTRVTLFQPFGGGADTSFEVPNCASTLEIAPDGRTALLAPTGCHQDPISVIDMTKRAFVKNLPGFGPVAYSPDGATAIGFARKADLAAVGVKTSAAYSLMFIDVETHAWELLELGDSMPIYQITPDGEVVLLFSVLHDASYDGIVLVDIATRTLRETSGPEVDLYEYVMTPDGEVVYLIDGGLFRLDVQTGAIVYLTLECRTPGAPSRCNPDLVNLLPDGQTLVLGYLHEAEFALYDIPSASLAKTFIVGSKAPAAAPRVSGP